MTIIATRVMKVMGDDGDIEVPVHIHSPVEDEYYRSWRCDYEIRFPRHIRRFRAFGVDAIQALQLVMLAIGAELMSNYYHYAGLLFWFEDGADYGFPTELAPEAGREPEHRAD